LPQGPSSDQVVKVLLRHGFAFVQQRGSHAKLRNDGPPARTVIVPMGRRNLAIGTFRSICRQAGLQPTDF
jgi:predicted RNA binding protein YcfA (HicA-like mRNA interferase family)